MINIPAAWETGSQIRDLQPETGMWRHPQRAARHPDYTGKIYPLALWHHPLFFNTFPRER